MFDPIRPHVVLWVQYMVIYTILLALIPSTWISVIWDQIIDPEFDLEHIEQPENRIIKLFYKASAKINTSVIMRNVVFVVLGVMTMLSSVYDLILTPCLLENPRVSLFGATFYLVTDCDVVRITRTDVPSPSWSSSPSSEHRTCSRCSSPLSPS